MQLRPVVRDHGIFYFTADALFPGVNGVVFVLLVMIPYLPLVPAVFRYSRVLWIYVERAGSPVDESASAYEKLRTHQLETGETDPPAGENRGPTPEDHP